MNHTSRLFCYGFPGLYGGAATELHHQILLWRAMRVPVHLIPTDDGYKREPLYQPMLKLGVTIHPAHAFDVIDEGDAVFGFCNEVFLKNLDQIYARSKNTVFINCMTWLFDLEKQRMKEGLIGAFVYQNDFVRQQNESKLRSLYSSSTVQFLTVAPYFDTTQFPFIEDRLSTTCSLGRISRQDTDKFASNTIRIYDHVITPGMKSGLFLGFSQKIKDKIGKPPEWIRTEHNHHAFSVQEFYKNCEIILQPMDTTENWPRIGLEAMASGSVLIVDNRGGWQQMVEHGVTGWLCDHERDFIYYASKMAYEPELRKQMARSARERLDTLSGLAASQESWACVFNAIGVQVPAMQLG